MPSPQASSTRRQTGRPCPVPIPPGGCRRRTWPRSSAFSLPGMPTQSTEPSFRWSGCRNPPVAAWRSASMDKLLDKRVAIVTGAGQGIGAAVARAYAAHGARVAIVDMNGEAAERIAAEVRATGGEALAVACNVADRPQINAMAETVASRLGGIDILVNNAGITRPAMLHKMTPEQWQGVLDVHLNGSFNCLQAVAPGMIERKHGRIINVTSVAGVLGTIGQINYSAAKAAICGMTKSAARELGRYRITVNAIAPGAAT